MIWIKNDRERLPENLGYRQKRKIQEDQTEQEHVMLIPPRGNRPETGIDIKVSLANTSVKLDNNCWLWYP